MNLNSEMLAKAMSRKPVEGHTPPPWRATGAAPASNQYGVEATRLPIAETTGYRVRKEERANGDLLAIAADLQDENQVLQAAVRQFGKLLKRARPADVPLQTKPVLKNGRLVGEELQEMTAGERRRAWLNVDIDAALALLPIEGESDD